MSGNIPKDCKITTDALLHDVIRASSDIDLENDGYHRRNYVRAVFAAIEGSTYGMRRLALYVWNQRQTNLKADELELLTETKFDKQGRAKNCFLRFEENIKFVFKIFAKIHGFSFQPDYKNKGWSALLEAAQIRHRLMHPKSSHDLDVSVEELNKIKIAADWYFPARNLLFEKAINEFKKEYRNKHSRFIF